MHEPVDNQRESSNKLDDGVEGKRGASGKDPGEDHEDAPHDHSRPRFLDLRVPPCLELIPMREVVIEQLHIFHLDRKGLPAYVPDNRWISLFYPGSGNNMGPSALCKAC